VNRDELFRRLGMTAHPEGGAFAEIYRSGLEISPAGFDGPRSASTSIYFLLGQGEFSAFHRIKSDEGWHFYLGGPLRIVEIDEEGNLVETTLGQDLAAGHKLTHVVRWGRWFASCPAEGSVYALVGCTVAPGFDFRDFEMADRDELTAHFPRHREVIASLTRPRR